MLQAGDISYFPLLLPFFPFPVPSPFIPCPLFSIFLLPFFPIFLNFFPFHYFPSPRIGNHTRAIATLRGDHFQVERDHPRAGNAPSAGGYPLHAEGSPPIAALRKSCGAVLLNSLPYEAKRSKKKLQENGRRTTPPQRIAVALDEGKQMRRMAKKHKKKNPKKEKRQVGGPGGVEYPWAPSGFPVPRVGKRPGPPGGPGSTWSDYCERHPNEGKKRKKTRGARVFRRKPQAEEKERRRTGPQAKTKTRGLMKRRETKKSSVLVVPDKTSGNRAPRGTTVHLASCIGHFSTIRGHAGGDMHSHRIQTVAGERKVFLIGQFHLAT